MRGHPRRSGGGGVANSFCFLEYPAQHFFFPILSTATPHNRMELTEGPLRPTPPDLPPTIDTPSVDLLSGPFGVDITPYIAIRNLGSGSFGEAILAHHPEHPDHLVVLKVPRRDDSARASEASRQLRSEADKLRTLHHPLIVPFLDYVVENPARNFIVMSYIAGGSLADELKGSGLPAPKAPKVARILIDVLQALEYMHLKGVLHLDIK